MAERTTNSKSVAKNAPKPEPAGPQEPGPDRLTGALNKAAVDLALEEAMLAAAEGELVAVGYLGLDGFAALNEAQGSLVTDHLLRDVVVRVRECLREQDVVGRYTRDEFVIIFRALTSKFETLALSSRLRARLSEPMRAGTNDVKLGPACGIANYGVNGTTPEALVAAAEKTMQTLKIAMRTAAVVAAQEVVTKAQAAVEAAIAEVARAEEAYEAAVALVAAEQAAAEATPS